jgi:predicted metal-binding protein
MKSAVTANWHHALLVCRKCQQKIGGGFGADGDAKLSKALKKALGSGKGRKGRVGVVEVACLDICPKGAVMLVDTRQPDVWRIVRRGADVAALADELR